MVLCSAKNCSSFSFSLILFIYFFILVCSILFQFCFLAVMTAMDKEDISVSHRIPKPSFSSVAAGNWNNVEASTPKIIVKFARRDTRDNNNNNNMTLFNLEFKCSLKANIFKIDFMWPGKTCGTNQQEIWIYRYLLSLI